MYKTAKILFLYRYIAFKCNLREVNVRYFFMSEDTNQDWTITAVLTFLPYICTESI